MAIWNEILEGTLNQLLAKRLGMQTGSPAPSVSPELQGSLVLESDRPEYSALKGELLAGARSAQAAVAAQFSFAALSNPTNSGLIVTVLRTMVTPAASVALYRVRPVGSVAGTPVNTQVRDTRWIQGSGSARAAATMTVGTVAALGLEVPFAWSNSATFFDLDEAVILRPGSSLVVELAAANVDLVNCTFLWRERAALPGELGL